MIQVLQGVGDPGRTLTYILNSSTLTLKNASRQSEKAWGILPCDLWSNNESQNYHASTCDQKQEVNEVLVFPYTIAELINEPLGLHT